jgi:hypothetical protein
MVIASHIEGRIRIRDTRLRQPELLAELRQELLQIPDIKKVSWNSKVGSLLILYRKARHALKEITNFLARFLGSIALPAAMTDRPTPRATAPSRRPIVTRRRVVNIGMLATLLLSLLVMAGSKQLHILAGLHFLGFLAIHLFQKRHTLLN